jgi:hypothetical protein
MKQYIAKTIDSILAYLLEPTLAKHHNLGGLTNRIYCPEFLAERSLRSKCFSVVSFGRFAGPSP